MSEEKRAVDEEIQDEIDDAAMVAFEYHCPMPDECLKYGIIPTKCRMCGWNFKEAVRKIEQVIDENG